MPPKAQKASSTPKPKKASSKKSAKAQSAITSVSTSVVSPVAASIACLAEADDTGGPKVSDYPIEIKYAASRAIARKLASHDSDLVDQVRNALGQHVIDRVAQEFYETRQQGKNVKNDFWKQLEKEFGLDYNPWLHHLPDAPSESDTDPDDVLPSLFQKAHGKNPALRNQAVSMIEQRLNVTDALPRCKNILFNN